MALPAIQSPQSVHAAPAARPSGSFARTRKPARAFSVTHARPECRSFETPAAKKMRLITSHIIRKGQVYSPLGAGGAADGFLAARNNASSDQPSPERAKARTQRPKTRTASAWWIFPKLCGRPMR